MFLFYSKDIHQDHIILHQEEHNHCKKVLRKSVGDTLHITDGRGHIFNCRIKVFINITLIKFLFNFFQTNYWVSNIYRCKTHIFFQ